MAEQTQEEQQIKQVEAQAEQEFFNQVKQLQKSELTHIDKYKIPTEYIKSVAKGFNKAFVFLGNQGIGKSYLTRQVLAKEKVSFIESRGVASPLALYQFIYKNNNKNTTLVFDDVAGLVNNANAFSILLGVLWEGVASWNSTTEKLKIPKQFIFEGNIIIIANKLEGANAEIVKSRCLTYTLELSREDKLEMMKVIAKQKHKALSPEQREEIVKFIEENSDSTNFDLRTQAKIEQLYQYDKENWIKLAKPLLKKSFELEILKKILENTYSVSHAEYRFKEETGLGRSSFYNYKKILIEEIGEDNPTP